MTDRWVHAGDIVRWGRGNDDHELGLVVGYEGDNLIVVVWSRPDGSADVLRHHPDRLRVVGRTEVTR